jgi:hypothetical protein
MAPTGKSTSHLSTFLKFLLALLGGGGLAALLKLFGYTTPDGVITSFAKQDLSPSSVVAVRIDDMSSRPPLSLDETLFASAPAEAEGQEAIAGLLREHHWEPVLHTALLRFTASAAGVEETTLNKLNGFIRKGIDEIASEVADTHLAVPLPEDALQETKKTSHNEDRMSLVVDTMYNRHGLISLLFTAQTNCQGNIVKLSRTLNLEMKPRGEWAEIEPDSGLQEMISERCRSSSLREPKKCLWHLSQNGLAIVPAHEEGTAASPPAVSFLVKPLLSFAQIRDHLLINQSHRADL